VARAALAALLLAAVMLTGIAVMASAQGQKYPFYPCKTCHAAMKLTGHRKVVPFHGIDLTKGPHRGLYCNNCHIPPTMQKLINNAEVYIPGIHPREKLMETNRVCAVCHPREYMDYMLLVHGNKTYTCPGGKDIKVKGYKGVIYDFHICPNGWKNLKAVPARACVECHDPHDPTYYALGPLPEPSLRPPPPNEDVITYGMIASGIGGLILIISAFLVPESRK